MITSIYSDSLELKSRLKALKRKYEELTKELEMELSESLVSDNMHNYFMLLYDREIVERQIDKVKSYIASNERLNKIKSYTTVEVGSHVHLQNRNNKLDLKIVDPNEARPTEGMISSNSPIGSAILGKVKGDEVVVDLPKGRINYRIVKVS